MALQRCERNGKPGYKYGPKGKCYTYMPGSNYQKKRARQKAARQGRAIEANN